MSKQYSESKDINLLLNQGEKQRDEIIDLYNSSLAEESIPDELLLKIKQYFENMRSVLDYLAQGKSKINFPMKSNEKDFDKTYTKIVEPYLSIYKKYQSFNNYQWLQYFNLLTNKNKHIGLVPQKRQEDLRVEVKHPSGGSVSWGSGVTFGGGVQVMGVPIDPNTQLPVQNNLVETTRTKWVTFTFDNANYTSLPSDVNALWLVKEVFDNVIDIVKEIESL